MLGIYSKATLKPPLNFWLLWIPNPQPNALNPQQWPKRKSTSQHKLQFQISIYRIMKAQRSAKPISSN